MNKRWLWFLPLVALMVVPFVLREPPVRPSDSAESLVIITPHNEITRAEFTVAFSQWAARELHKNVVIDWRAPGGTADIRRQVDDQFRSSARQTFAGRFPDGDIKSCVDVPKDERVSGARTEFLSSDIGIGIDLFFGGGSFDHGRLADQGYVVNAGLLQEMPETFRSDIIPAERGGERYYDPAGRWYGVCLSSFGICMNRDRLVTAGMLTLPHSWDDLGDPRLFGAAAMADPSKSGSVNRCFESMLQMTMARAVSREAASREISVMNRTSASAAALNTGWREGFLLIKRIAANSRYVSDGGSRVVQDIARGDAAIGMTLDAYGRSQAAWSRHQSGIDRLAFVLPEHGSCWSADPISLFRGAPHRDLAKAFMRFCLLPVGQRLWHHRPATPDGPQRDALFRLAIRSDCYGSDDLPHMTDASINPYVGEGLMYQRAWTGSYFGLIATTIRTVIVDLRPELSAAWQAIIAAGGPEAVPQAMVELGWLPFEYEQAKNIKERLTGPADKALPLLRSWVIEAREHYRRAESLALQARAHSYAEAHAQRGDHE